MLIAGGLLHVVAAILAVSGGTKLVSPTPATLALGALRLPARRATARALGAAEVLLGLVTLLRGGAAPALAVAVAYLVLAVAAVRLLQRGVGACGCFGSGSAPPSRLHVVVDLAAAAAGATAAAQGGPSIFTTLHSGGGAAIALLGYCALATWLVIALLTALPDALGAIGRPTNPAVRLFEVRPPSS